MPHHPLCVYRSVAENHWVYFTYRYSNDYCSVTKTQVMLALVKLVLDYITFLLSSHLKNISVLNIRQFPPSIFRCTISVSVSILQQRCFFAAPSALKTAQLVSIQII